MHFCFYEKMVVGAMLSHAFGKKHTHLNPTLQCKGDEWKSNYFYKEPVI